PPPVGVFAAAAGDRGAVQQRRPGAGGGRRHASPEEGGVAHRRGSHGGGSAGGRSQGGIRREEMDRRWKRVKEYPFDSERKRMSVLVEGPGGERMLLVKGAPDVLLERCTHILRNGKAVPLSREQREEVLRMNAQLAAMALRNLAF